jgi:uncharacterized protein YecT (DUF1311 family)
MNTTLQAVVPLVIATCVLTTLGAAPSPRWQATADRGTRVVTVDCRHSSTQAELTDCSAREAKQAQDLLDKLLQDLQKSLRPAQRQRLHPVQTTWLCYREAHCEWQAQFFEGGSIQPSIYSGCLADLTWSRIDELKTLLCDGWGAPCPASQRYDRPTDSRRK